MNKRKVLHRLITRIDDIVMGTVLYGLLFVAVFTLTAECILGPLQWSADILVGAMAAAIAITCITGNQRRYRAFVSSIELTLLLTMLTAMLPIQILISGLRSIPRYYRGWIECLTMLMRFR